MNSKFFAKKIRGLTDDKLRELLRLRYDSNKEIIDLAIDEAKKRGLELPQISVPEVESVVESGDLEKLARWNWGAFFLGPFWALANKLEQWTLWTFIPFINIPAVIYLALRGNRLAYDKSEIKDVEQFMALQKEWSTQGIRYFCILICLWFVAGIIQVY